MESAAPSPLQMSKSAWRDYLDQQQLNPQKPSVTLGIAASFTTNTLVPFVGGHLLSKDIKPEIFPGPYNQIFQVCLDPVGHFGEGCDTVALLWRLEDIMLEELNAYLLGEGDSLARAIDKLNILASSILQLRSSFTGLIIVSTPPCPTCVPAHPLNLISHDNLGRFHKSLLKAFDEKIGSIKGVRIFDLDLLQRQFGIQASFDSRQWYLYHQPFSETFLYEMGRTLGRIVVAAKQAPKKCAVLDCDNTLWGGVVGEDGIEGIQIGEEFPGSAFKDFQKLLLYWRSQGVMLALLSKNNEQDVWDVFEKHSGMVLKREHISAWQINWNPKADNIPLIAKTLNIGIDSLVFIDDSSMEVSYMRQARPEVSTVQVPDESADIVPYMSSLEFFDRLDVTREDRERAGMMAAEQQRDAIAGSLTKEEFIKALNLHIDFFPAKAEDLDRITQLINKTNQFNLSTIRRTLEEVQTLAKSDKHRIYGLRVTDKFGEYGLTGVVIAERQKSRWHIDTFLLSCRVLGRGVETCLLKSIAKDAKADDASEMTASYIPTPKNAPVSSFLPDHGFKKMDDKVWATSIDSLIDPPDTSDDGSMASLASDKPRLAV